MLVYEAMKMENDVQASQPGVVKRVFVAEGDAVADGQVMIEYAETGKAAPAAEEEKAPAGPGKGVKAPMPGKIIEIKVKPGDKVKKDAVVLVYEAMKMENDVQAPEDLTVTKVLVAPDDAVADGQVLIEYK